MDELIKLLDEHLTGAEQDIIEYVKKRSAIINDIVTRERMENPDFKPEDIQDQFLLDWIETIELMDDYDNSIRDAAYLAGIAFIIDMVKLYHANKQQ